MTDAHRSEEKGHALAALSIYVVYEASVSMYFEQSMSFSLNSESDQGWKRNVLLSFIYT